MAVKTKAIFLICLLVGHEAARIREASRLELATRTAAKQMQADNGPAATEWQTANWACRWSTWNGGCIGPAGKNGAENSTETCVFRYLPLDNLPPWSSQGCRYSDAYMLEHDRNNYFQLQAKVLSEKAKKFSENCADASFANLKCIRRAKHMYRAMTFLSKAQDSKFVASMSQEQKTSEAAVFEEALGHMKVIVGPDAEYVMMLKDKMKARGGSVHGIHEVIQLLTNLLKGDAKQKESARAKIISMDSEKKELTPEEEAKQQEFMKNLEEKKDEMSDLLDNDLNDLDNEAEESAGALGQNVSSLVEQDSEWGRQKRDHTAVVVVKGIAFLIVMWLVVAAIVSVVLSALSILVMWSVVILVGCAAYDAGESRGGRISADGTLDCMVNIFKWPVNKGVEALKYVWDEFAPREFRD